MDEQKVPEGVQEQRDRQKGRGSNPDPKAEGVCSGGSMELWRVGSQSLVKIRPVSGDHVGTVPKAQIES